MAASEFDKSFQRSLAGTIISDRLPVGICRALQLDNDKRIIKSSLMREFIYKFNRVSLAWMCKFNRVNFIRHSSIRVRHLTVRENIYRLTHDPSKRGVFTRLWPSYILVTYILTLVKLLFNTYFQYIYDANKIKLQRLQEHLSNPGERDRLVNELHLNVESLRRDFQQRALEARKILKLIGASHLEWAFSAQAMTVILSQAICWTVIYPMFVHMGDWIWLTAKAILCEPNEHRTRLRLVLDELQHFTMDSLSYSRVKLEQFDLELVNMAKDEALRSDQLKLGAATAGPDAAATAASGSVGRNRFQLLARLAFKMRSKYLAHRHQRTIEQLKFIALEGRLNALNRTPTGRDKLALFYLASVTIYALYIHSFMIAFNRYLRSYHSARGIRLEFHTLRDILSTICFTLFVELNLIKATFFCPMLMFAVYDLLKATTHLGDLINHVIRANELRYQEIVNISHRANSISICQSIHRVASYSRHRSHPQDITNHATQKRCKHLARDLELDLLMLVLQFRLTMRTFILVKRPLNQIASMITTFAISVPIVFCIHGAYFSAELKLVTLGGSLATAAACLCILAPLGLLYRRTVTVFSALWKLVAQLSHYETEPSINRYLALDSSVTLFILRRMLADVRFTMEQLAISWLSIPITYANLIRIFSWILLFIMAGSILSVRLFGEGLGSIMSDPFGLFKFLKIRSTS